MVDTTTAPRSVFMPIVSVYDDGTITVDWGSSFSHYEDMQGDIEPATNSEAAERAAAIIDMLVGDVDEGAGMRNLADYIDAQS